MMNIKDNPFYKKGSALFSSFALLLILAFAAFVFACLLLIFLEAIVDWLGFTLAKKDLNPRDFGLLFFGVFSPSFALMGFHFSNRRNQASDKQNQLQSEQNQLQSEQNQLQSERNRNDVFAKTVQLLGSKNLYQRLGAIAALRQIGSAQNSPFTTDIIAILEDFIRRKPDEIKEIAEKNQKNESVSDEVNRAFMALCHVVQKQQQENSEIRANLSGYNLPGLQAPGITITQVDLLSTYLFFANLSDANLSYAKLSGADLTDANLSGANLSGAKLFRANLRNAHLSDDADLSDADLSGAYLSDANLSGATLSAANFRGCRNLTMEQIQSAKWDKNEPPRNLPSEIVAHPDIAKKLPTLEELFQARKLTKEQVIELGISYRPG